MGTKWIDEVMATNTAIVAAEARFAEQMVRLVAAYDRGEDTTYEQALLSSYQTSIRLLRVIQGQFLHDARTTA